MVAPGQIGHLLHMYFERQSLSLISSFSVPPLNIDMLLLPVITKSPLLASLINALIARPVSVGGQ